MKNFKFLSLLGIAFLSCTLIGCTDTQPVDDTENNNESDFIIEEITTNEDAVAYNDQLVNITDACFLAEGDVWTAYDTATAEEVKAAIDSLLSVCNTTLNEVKDVEALDGDSSLKDGILVVIEKYISYYNKFNELIPYIDYDLENMTEEDATAYETIASELDVINSELAEANINLAQIQETFAANHGYDLDDEEENIEEGIEEIAED